MTVEEVVAPVAASLAASATRPQAEAPASGVAADLSPEPPVSPPGVPLVYLPVEVSESAAVNALRQQASGAITPEEPRLVYEPAIFGTATVRFRDTTKGIDEERDYNMLVPIAGKVELLSWKNAELVDVDPNHLEDEGESGAFYYVGVGSSGDPKKAVVKLRSGLDEHLYGTTVHEVAYHKGLKVYAESGESQQQFAARVMQAAKEMRDAELDAVHAKYQKKMDDLSKRLEKEQQELAADRAEYTGRIAEEALTGASTVASFFGFGRRRTLSSMATKRRMSANAKSDIAESEQMIARMQADMTALEGAYRQEAEAVAAKWEAATGDLDQLKLTPRRSDIDVNLVALAWAPHWWIDYRDARGRKQIGNIPAYGSVEK
jgi:hypothetical protein